MFKNTCWGEVLTQLYGWNLDQVSAKFIFATWSRISRPTSPNPSPSCSVFDFWHWCYFPIFCYWFCCLWQQTSWLCTTHSFPIQFQKFVVMWAGIFVWCFVHVCCVCVCVVHDFVFFVYFLRCWNVVSLRVGFEGGAPLEPQQQHQPQHRPTNQPNHQQTNQPTNHPTSKNKPAFKADLHYVELPRICRKKHFVNPNWRAMRCFGHHSTLWSTKTFKAFTWWFPNCGTMVYWDNQKGFNNKTLSTT